MPRVAYTAAGFPAPFLAVNGAADLQLGWPLLVWAAISVGKAELLHITRYGQFSLFEIAYRGAMIFANLVEDGAGRFARSAAYDGLDPSEKGAISYFLGLTIAKAFAENLLQVPWLMHLDVYRDELRVVLKGKSRPDLVGQTAAREWIAIESKGRSNSFDAEALDRAKSQAGMLGSVDGQVPAALAGMVTYFGDNQLQLTVSDPPPRDRHERVHLPLTRSKLLAGYYRPFRAWLEGEPQAHAIERGDTTYVVAQVDSVDLTVGLAMDFRADKLPQSDIEARRPSHGLSYYAGSDGILVEVGPLWSLENMRREPQERSRGV